MTDDDIVWIARLTPAPGSSIDILLQQPLDLDIWERHPHQLVVAATASRLREIERRQLAQVERVETVAAFLARQDQHNEP